MARKRQRVMIVRPPDPGDKKAVMEMARKIREALRPQKAPDRPPGS